MIKIIDKEYNPFRILTSKEYFYLKYKLEKEKINDLISINNLNKEHTNNINQKDILVTLDDLLKEDVN